MASFHNIRGNPEAVYTLVCSQKVDLAVDRCEGRVSSSQRINEVF